MPIIKSGSLSAAYQRLIQLGLYHQDPLLHFLWIHSDVDLTSMNLHSQCIQDVQENTHWDEYFAHGDVFRLIAKRKNGNASDRRGMKNDFLKILQQDSSFLHPFIKCILC